MVAESDLVVRLGGLAAIMGGLLWGVKALIGTASTSLLWPAKSSDPLFVTAWPGARPAGFEPATRGLEVRCSVLLSYGRWTVPQGPRAGEGNRTPIASLEGWSSTVELHPHAGLLQVVGARGFEPPTPCSQSRCATRLRHAPSETTGEYTRVR